MKSILTILLIALLAFFSRSQGQWAWMKGDTASNDFFGVVGVPSMANEPACRYASNGWTDSNGNLWMYAGQYDGLPYHEKDMWRYTVQTNQWDLIYDANTSSSPPNYGTLGVPGPFVQPGSLNFGTPHWIDEDDNLWTMTTFSGDIFKFDVTIQQWTWMNGTGNGNTSTPPIYGTQGVPSSTATPGQFLTNGELNNEWIDSAGDFWLFHQGYGTVWKYSPSLNQWTWVHGSNAPPGSIAPYYSTIGEFDLPGLNTPGSYDCGYRVLANWQDSGNHFWHMLNRQNPNHLEIWEYDPVANKWACHLDEPNIYSNAVQCEESNFARPKIVELEQRAVWVDDCDNVYTFCFDSLDTCQLWRYNPVSAKFTLINTYNSNQFGTQGIPSASNHPVLTIGPLAWTANNEFWYRGSFSGGNSVLWKYIPDSVIADFSAAFDPTLCSMVFTDLSNTGCNEVKSWQWDFGDGTTSNDQNPSHTYSNAGIYSVSLIIQNCSWDADTSVQQINVLVDCPIELSTQDDTLCRGDCVFLDFETTIPAESILVDGVLQSDVNFIERCPTQTTEYVITAIASNGTIDEDSITLFVLDPPNVYVESNQTICPPDSVLLIAEADLSFSFLWSTGSTENSTIVTNTGSYWVQVDDGQCTSESTVSIVINCPTNIEMPNVFTPSNNGINDLFLPRHHEGIKIYSLRIYNRWGNEVFSSQDINQGWNGKHDEKECAEGVYFWIVQYTNLSDVNQRIEGHVTLIR